MKRQNSEQPLKKIEVKMNAKLTTSDLKRRQKLRHYM